MDNSITDFFNTIKKKNKFFSLGTNGFVGYKAPAGLIIIGDHTHYNDGILLSAVVDKYCQMFVKTNKQNELNLYSESNFVNVKLHEADDKQNYEFPFNTIHKIVNFLIKRRILKHGVDVVFSHNFPASLGIGANTAIQLAFINSVNQAANLKLNKTQILELSREIELDILGKISNKVLHHAIANCKRGTFFYYDLREDKFARLEFPEDKFDLFLVDTGFAIDNPADICNARINECEIGTKGLRLYIWGIKNLRDVSPDFLNKHLNMLPRRIFNRCLYNVKERMRVEKCLPFLKKKKFDDFGKELFNSQKDLDQLYNLSFEEHDFLIQAFSKLTGVIGAKLISCSNKKAVLLITKKSQSKIIIDKTKQLFQQQYKQEIEFNKLLLTTPITRLI